MFTIPLKDGGILELDKAIIVAANLAVGPSLSLEIEDGKEERYLLTLVAEGNVSILNGVVSMQPTLRFHVNKMGGKANRQ